MPANLHKEIDKIKLELLTLGRMVEAQLQKAIHAVNTNDPDLADRVIADDVIIDEREIELEEDCLKLLALYQPVASDLRFLIAVIKINNDLERIADYAGNIAKRFKTSRTDPEKFNFDYTAMTDLTIKMLKMTLKALVKWDVQLVNDVRKMDEQVNQMRNEAYDTMKRQVREKPDSVSAIINLYLISRHLERVGDHVKNIAEEVNFLIEGEIVRHAE